MNGGLLMGGLLLSGIGATFAFLLIGTAHGHKAVIIVHV